MHTVTLCGCVCRKHADSLTVFPGLGQGDRSERRGQWSFQSSMQHEGNLQKHCKLDALQQGHGIPMQQCLSEMPTHLAQ